MRPSLLTSAADDVDSGLTGIAGIAADAIDAIGEFGVGVLTFIETVFPPIPSEIVLSLAGYLAERGTVNLVLVIVMATAGALLGALVLYGLGAWLGEERAKDWLTKLPLVERDDFDKASDWFRRHGTAVVFFGRCIPIVRSLVSLPAGAQRMSLPLFMLLTTLGSAIWNSALIGLGYALGTQYERVEEYVDYLDYVIYAAIIGIVVWLVIRRVRRPRPPKANGGGKASGGPKHRRGDVESQRG